MLFNNINKRLIILSNSTSVKIITRTMWNSSRIVKHLTKTPTINATAYLRNTSHSQQARSYAVERHYGYYPSANLNNTSRQDFAVLQQFVIGHINKLVFRCANAGCASIKCNGLCTHLISVYHKGNYTHQPPVNSTYVLISEFDIYGNPQKQYFVYNNNYTEFKKDPTTASDTGLTYSKKADDFTNKNE